VSEEINYDRRRFLGTAAMTIARRPAQHVRFCGRTSPKPTPRVAETAVPLAPTMAGWTLGSLPLVPKGTGTNPEQLLAAGWSAGFLSAIKIVAGKKKVTLPIVLAIDVEVDLGIAHGVHGLAARLNVSLSGLEREVAQTLVDGAQQVCPYSRATRGNIDVAINVV
jgi:osmotically inducible protein OsmC